MDKFTIKIFYKYVPIIVESVVCPAKGARLVPKNVLGTALGTPEMMINPPVPPAPPFGTKLGAPNTVPLEI